MLLDKNIGKVAGVRVLVNQESLKNNLDTHLSQVIHQEKEKRRHHWLTLKHKKIGMVEIPLLLKIKGVRTTINVGMLINLPKKAAAEIDQTIKVSGRLQSIKMKFSQRVKQLSMLPKRRRKKAITLTLLQNNKESRTAFSKMQLVAHKRMICYSVSFELNNIF